MPLTDFTGTAKIQPWRTIQGPALLELAPLANSTPSFQDADTQFTSSGAAVGITNEVGFNPNISSEEAYCAQLKHPYAIDITRRAEQISTELQALDVWNFAMALSYDSQSVIESSYFYMDPTSNATAAGQSGQNSPYRHVRLTTEGISNDGTTTSNEQVTVLLKARPIGEEVTYGPETKSTVPLTLHAVASGNSSNPDRAGVMYNDQQISDPGY